MYYNSYQNGYIIKLTGAGWIQSGQHCVIYHWKADSFSIPMVFEELWYIKIIIGNLTAIFQIITVELPIILLMYTISKFLKHHRHAEWISFPMMYHTVLHTLHSACYSQFNNIPFLVTIVTHIFPPKWFSWQPKSSDLSAISLLTGIPNMVKIGLELAKLQS